jgi:hypothetical protein
MKADELAEPETDTVEKSPWHSKCPEREKDLERYCL